MKLITKLSTALLSISMVASLASCGLFGGKDSTSTNTNSTNTSQNTNTNTNSNSTNTNSNTNSNSTNGNGNNSTNTTQNGSTTTNNNPVTYPVQNNEFNGFVNVSGMMGAYLWVKDADSEDDYLYVSFGDVLQPETMMTLKISGEDILDLVEQYAEQYIAEYLPEELEDLTLEDLFEKYPELVEEIVKLQAALQRFSFSQFVETDAENPGTYSFDAVGLSEYLGETFEAVLTLIDNEELSAFFSNTTALISALDLEYTVTNEGNNIAIDVTYPMLLDADIDVVLNEGNVVSIVAEDAEIAGAEVDFTYGVSNEGVMSLNLAIETEEIGRGEEQDRKLENIKTLSASVNPATINAAVDYTEVETAYLGSISTDTWEAGAPVTLEEHHFTLAAASQNEIDVTFDEYALELVKGTILARTFHADDYEEDELNELYEEDDEFETYSARLTMTVNEQVMPLASVGIVEGLGEYYFSADAMGAAIDAQLLIDDGYVYGDLTFYQGTYHDEEEDEDIAIARFNASFTAMFDEEGFFLSVMVNHWEEVDGLEGVFDAVYDLNLMFSTSEYSTFLIVIVSDTYVLDFNYLLDDDAQEIEAHIYQLGDVDPETEERLQLHFFDIEATYGSDGFNATGKIMEQYDLEIATLEHLPATFDQLGHEALAMDLPTFIAMMMGGAGADGE